MSHMQCLTCGHFCRSHAHLLSHLATAHPALLDGATVGRLGAAFFYQPSAKLFHCSLCFFTNQDFSRVYQHLLTTHCSDRDREGDENRDRAAADKEEGKTEEKLKENKMVDDMETEEEKMKESLKRKRPAPELLTPDPGRSSAKSSNPSAAPDPFPAPSMDPFRISAAQAHSVDPSVNPLVAPDPFPDPSADPCRPSAALAPSGDHSVDPSMALAPLVDPCRPSEVLAPSADPSTAQDTSVDSLLQRSDGLYVCRVCGWKHKLRILAVNHVVRKHDAPRPPYNIAHKRSVRIPAVDNVNSQSVTAMTEEEDDSMSPEMMQQEVEVTTKVLRFINNRFECQLCGWKTKLKGFALSHVERCHDVRRGFECSLCGQAFFVPSRLREHTRIAHRPGRYFCPFCSFRTDYLGGFRRHSSRCNARDGDRLNPSLDQDQERDLEDFDERRPQRPRRRTGRAVVEEEDEEEDEQDQD